MPPNSALPTDQRSPSGLESDLARVRDNQRRSRARRKGYLQELESKLRKCEALGVQASVDIQLAARGVSEENARLREENGKLKEENERLKQLLRKSEDGALDMADHRIIHSSRKANQLHRVYDSGAAELNEGQASQAPAPAPSVAGMNYHGDAVVRSASLSSTQHRDVSTSSGRLAEADRTKIGQTMIPKAGPPYTYIIPTQPGTSAQGSCNRSSDDLLFGDDTSSCEYAAHIITSMRADVSTEDVRADIGCGSDVNEWRRCKVDNSKLFNAVDRYTG